MNKTREKKNKKQKTKKRTNNNGKIHYSNYRIGHCAPAGQQLKCSVPSFISNEKLSVYKLYCMKWRYDSTNVMCSANYTNWSVCLWALHFEYRMVEYEKHTNHPKSISRADSMVLLFCFVIKNIIVCEPLLCETIHERKNSKTYFFFFHV